MSAAILIHGCHLGAPDWENLVWGSPEKGVLGRVPTGLNKALEVGSPQLILGTGASEKDGLKEARYTQRFAFGKLKDGANLPFDVQSASQLLKQAVLDELSTNSDEEIHAAIAWCRQAGVKVLYLVSSPTHIARCYQSALTVNPADVQIVPVASDTSFAGYGPQDVVIVEPPHRGDDAQLSLPEELRRHNLVRGMFKASAKDPVAYAKALDELNRSFN